MEWKGEGSIREGIDTLCIDWSLLVLLLVRGEAYYPT